jgi:hypothetical protein
MATVAGSARHDLPGAARCRNLRVGDPVLLEDPLVLRLAPLHGRIRSFAPDGARTMFGITNVAFTSSIDELNGPG